DLVSETVGTVVVRRRGVVKRTVVGGGPSGESRSRHQRPDVAAVSAGRVVRGHGAAERRVFVGREAVVHRQRQIVYRCDSDVYGGAADVAVGVGDLVSETVGTVVVRRRGVVKRT